MPWAPGADPYQPQDFGYDNWDKHLAPNFRAALQNIYGRGLDIGSEAPWQMVDQAFPRAGSAQLRQTHDQDLLDAARMFMSGQAPQKPDMVTPPPTWYDDPSQDGGTGQGGGVGPGGIVGAHGPATSIFGSVMGGPLSGAPAAAVAALTAALSGGLTLPGIGKIDMQNPVSRAFENAFPLGRVDSEGKVNPQVPVSPAFFNSAFTTPTAFAEAIANAQMNADAFSESELSVDVPSPDPSPQGVVNSARAALANDPNNQSVSPFSTPQGHPAFGFQGFNAPSQSPAPYGDTPSVRGDGGKLGLDTPDPDQNFDFDPAAGTSSSGTGTGTGTGAGVSGGAAPGGSSGGTSTSGSGDAFKKGGMVHDTHKGFARKKGSHVVPIDAHEGEFVVNQAATKAARPQLEALNSLIPPDAKREDIAALMDKASRFFDVA